MVSRRFDAPEIEKIDYLCKLKSRTEILVPIAAIQAVPIAVIAWYRLHRYAWYRYSAIVSYQDEHLKSIMGMMSLGLDNGETLTVVADGSDESAAVAHIERFLSGQDA